MNRLSRLIFIVLNKPRGHNMILSPEQIHKKLQAVQGWKFVDNHVVKTYRFPDFTTALQLVNTVGVIAEHYNHHPDIVLKYGEATFSLTTHDKGGVTEKDIDMVIEIEKAATAFV